MFDTTDGKCDRVLGPIGFTECMSLAGYTKHQWATYLTNTYIELLTGGRHQCKEDTSSFCYYQCMLEYHEKDAGEYTNKR